MPDDSTETMSDTPETDASDLSFSLGVVHQAKLDLGLAIKNAMESTIETWATTHPGVLPVVTVKTSPEIAYGGIPRRVTASVSIDNFHQITPTADAKTQPTIAVSTKMLAALRQGFFPDKGGALLLRYAADLVERQSPSTAKELRDKADAEQAAINAATNGVHE